MRFEKNNCSSLDSHSCSTSSSITSRPESALQGQKVHLYLRSLGGSEPFVWVGPKVARAQNTEGGFIRGSASRIQEMHFCNSGKRRIKREIRQACYQAEKEACDFSFLFLRWLRAVLMIWLCISANGWRLGTWRVLGASSSLSDNAIFFTSRRDLVS